MNTNTRCSLFQLANLEFEFDLFSGVGETSDDLEGWQLLLKSLVTDVEGGERFKFR